MLSRAFAPGSRAFGAALKPQQTVPTFLPQPHPGNFVIDRHKLFLQANINLNDISWCFTYPCKHSIETDAPPPYLRRGVRSCSFWQKCGMNEVFISHTRTADSSRLFSAAEMFAVGLLQPCASPASTPDLSKRGAFSAERVCCYFRTPSKDATSNMQPIM